MTDLTARGVRIAMPWLAMAVLLIVWELACIVFDMPEIILPGRPRSSWCSSSASTS